MTGASAPTRRGSETTVSRQPREPHRHSTPAGSTCTWPTSPAVPPIPAEQPPAQHQPGPDPGRELHVDQGVAAGADPGALLTERAEVRVVLDHDLHAEPVGELLPGPSSDPVGAGCCCPPPRRWRGPAVRADRAPPGVPRRRAARCEPPPGAPARASGPACATWRRRRAASPSPRPAPTRRRRSSRPGRGCCRGRRPPPTPGVAARAAGARDGLGRGGTARSASSSTTPSAISSAVRVETADDDSPVRRLSSIRLAGPWSVSAARTWRRPAPPFLPFTEINMAHETISVRH